MLSQKSIRYSFALQLVLALIILIVTFSIILYSYIKISIYEELDNELTSKAISFAVESSSNLKKITSLDLINNHYNKPKIVIKKNEEFKIKFKLSRKHGVNFLTILYPYNKNKYLFISITKNISNTDKLLDKTLTNILMINFIMLFLILFYALFLSRMLLLPIKSLANKLAKINESFLQTVDTQTLPIEFVPLGKSINGLVKRIKTFTLSQEELFIGASHELKTPLAVMKTKNEVTLLRLRDLQRYKDTLKENINTINEMNTMVSNILKIGRQESAQFEEPIEIDLTSFLKEKANNFKILAHQKEKKLQISIENEKYSLKTQPTLLIHILQNFIQNAIKFTPIGKTIYINAKKVKEGYLIKIIDEGRGIDEKQDLFAPFKRFGNESGAGLGLFLAKKAADALNIQISIKNTQKKDGAIASIFIPLKKI